MKSITVFTPTYNRAALLPRLYRSLQRQTCQDFIWMIIDDGSTDGTKELVEFEKIKKWDGHLPTVAGSEGTSTIIDMRTNQQQ